MIISVKSGIRLIFTKAPENQKAPPLHVRILIYKNPCSSFTLSLIFIFHAASDLHTFIHSTADKCG